MCPRQRMSRPIGFMEFDLFKKIIDETAIVPIDNITLHHFGDPLLHPKVVDMIEYAKNAGVRHVNLSTNAVALTPDKAERLLDSRLDLIIFSVDGTKQIYEQVRVGAKWETVTNNIRNFLEMKSVGKPDVWLQIIDMPSVDVEDAVSFWRSIENIDEIQVKKFETWGHQVQGINDIKSKQQISPRQACPILLTSMVICWDGVCVPCCRDYDAKIDLGNVKEENVIAIFNGFKYANFRRKHEEGNFDNPLCRNCVEWAEALGMDTNFTS